VHLFKNAAKILMSRGHHVYFIARDYQITHYLLKTFDLPYINMGRSLKGLHGKIAEFFVLMKNTLAELSRHRPDVVLGEFLHGLPTSMLKLPSFEFVNGDVGIYPIIYKTIDRATRIFTPEHYRLNLGPRHIRYRGFQQIAYLHPRYFHPDESVLDELGISKNEKYLVLRTNAFDATTHDFGLSQLSEADLLHLIKELSKRIRVFVSTEGRASRNIAPYLIRLKPEQIHHVLYFAELTMTQTITMATESCLLGTPSVVTHPKFLDLSDFRYLAKNGLLWRASNVESALRLVLRLFEGGYSKSQFASKALKIRENCTDLTKLMVWLSENYPSCLSQLHTNKIIFEP
jgi:predicted glycosyltransferase